MKEELMLKLSRLSDEEFEEFKKNFAGEDLKAVVTLRIWGKMKYNKDFYTAVQNTLSKATYEHFNNN